MSDPFELLGLPASFELDPALLLARHRELSKALHPDRYAGHAASERRQALGRAIEVNEAFRVLKDPVRRAEHLLRRLGAEVGEQSERRVAPDFLMRIMELREALGERRRAADAAGVERLCQEVRVAERAAEARLQAGFQEVLSGFRASDGPRQVGSQEPGQESRQALARRAEDLLPIVAELRYYARFFSEAHAILDELG